MTLCDSCLQPNEEVPIHVVTQPLGTPVLTLLHLAAFVRKFGLGQDGVGVIPQRRRGPR